MKDGDTSNTSTYDFLLAVATVVVLVLLVLAGCGYTTRPATTYNRMDGKCELTRMEWNAGEASGCYCKIVGTSEHNDRVIVYIPVDARLCR